MNKLQEFTAQQSTDVLIDSLRLLEEMIAHQRSAELIMSRVAICEELEKRFPFVEAVLEAWCELDLDGTYVEVLIGAIRKGA